MLSSNASMQSLLSSLSDMNDRQTKISIETSSGLRISALSDDAVAAGQAVTMASTLQRDDAFVATAATVGTRMQATDSALSSVVSLMTSAISTVVGGLTDSTTQTAKNAAAQQLAGIRDSIVSLANSSYAGRALFTGGFSSRPFVEDASGNITYSGDGATNSISLTSGGKLQTSLAGSAVFTASGASVFGTINAAIAALQSGSTVNASTITGNLTNALDNVTSQRAVLNSSQSRLSNESSYVTAQKANLSADQSTLLSADTATLATELSAVTTQRSALLSTIGIVQKGSLFDYL